MEFGFKITKLSPQFTTFPHFFSKNVFFLDFSPFFLSSVQLSTGGLEQGGGVPLRQRFLLLKDELIVQGGFLHPKAGGENEYFVKIFQSEFPAFVKFSKSAVCVSTPLTTSKHATHYP